MNAPHLINLLPKSAVNAFKRDYQFRFATLCVLTLVFILIINMLLLVPAYIYAHSHAASLQAKLDSLDQLMQTNDQSQVATRIANLTKEQTYLQGLQKAPKDSALLDAVLASPRPGISLTTFAITPPAAGGAGTIVLTGTADTREDLRAYTVSLGTLKFVSNVNLPISAYASESNIPFTITLSGSLAL